MDSSAYAWAAHECSSADFHDARLTKRFMAIAASFLQHSQSSIPQACRDWPAAKAAYRFFSNSKVQSGVMLEAHQTGLMDSVVSLSTILVAQDTTALNLSNKDIAGLGSIGDGGKSGTLKGLYVHSGLVMTTAGIPLGLSYQKIYTRDAKTKTEAYRKKAKSLPITEKETGRWIEAIERTKQVFATQPHTNVVVVGDRESDIYEVFQKGRELGMDLLVRTSSNRNLANKTDGSTIKLFDKVKAGTVTRRLYQLIIGKPEQRH
jgi:hypothetical protein